MDLHFFTDFDISKAFDKVWHVGLLYKLIKLKLSIYLIKYLKDLNFFYLKALTEECRHQEWNPNLLVSD